MLMEGVNNKEMGSAVEFSVPPLLSYKFKMIQKKKSSLQKI